MEGWRLDSTLDALEAHAGRKKVPHCVFCHHPGSQRHHDKWGCTYCGSDRSCTRNVCISCPCEWHEKQHQVELRAVEFSIRQKAMKLPSFPPKNVIQEFMETKDKVAALRLTWKRPKLFHFQRLCSLKLEWEEEYSLAKFLPLLTLHDMTALLEHGHFPSIQPHAVIKSRVRHGVSCYEVEWNKLAGDTTTETEFYVTVETQDLFARCFPLTVQQFAQDTATKRKGTSKGKSKKAAEAAKQMTDDDTVIADVTSGLGRLQLYTEGVERGDACTGFTGASAAGSWMQGTDGDKEEFDDSCILLDTPGDVVNGLGDSPTHARLDRVSMCDSYLSISPVTDASDTSEMNSSKDVMPSRKAEEHSDNDDDVFLSLSERLQRQKVTRLEGETGRKPLTTSHTQDVTDTSVARSASSNSAAVEPVSNKLTNRENYSAGANELSVMTNRLPSTTRQLYSSLRQPGVGRDVSFNSSQLVKLQTEDNKASGQSTCSLQEVSADRHHVQNGVCFDLQLQDEEDSQPEGLVEHLNKKSDSTVVDSVESKVSGIHSNAPVHQLSQADDGDSYSCTDDELGNSPDLEKCNKQQLHSSPQSHDDTQTKMCSEKVECSQPNSHYSISRSVERIRSCWARDVVMSPDLFDSSCDDDNSFCTSTLTPSVGMMQNQRDTDRSLCGISQWDIETPMHSARPGKHDNGAGRTDGGRVHSDVGQQCYSFKNSSFSCYSFDIDCSSTVKLARSAHISSIKTTALDDSAFGSCDSSAAYTDSVSTHTPQRSQSLGDSVCEDIGDFKLHSSLLCELDYLCDSTDLDDSVFICSVEPSASDTGSNRTHGTPSRCRPNLPTKPPCQQHCHKTNDTPPQIVQGRSDIVLDNVPTKCNIQATCVKSTANGDISPQQVSSPVCLADRLKLRLAKTNKAYLVSCLSRDTSTTSSSFNDC